MYFQKDFVNGKKIKHDQKRNYLRLYNIYITFKYQAVFCSSKNKTLVY
jgi:hypothetical protein